MALREARNNFEKYGARLLKWSEIVIDNGERSSLKCKKRNVYKSAKPCAQKTCTHWSQANNKQH